MAKIDPGNSELEHYAAELRSQANFLAGLTRPKLKNFEAFVANIEWFTRKVSRGTGQRERAVNEAVRDLYPAELIQPSRVRAAAEELEDRIHTAIRRGGPLRDEQIREALEMNGVGEPMGNGTVPNAAAAPQVRFTHQADPARQPRRGPSAPTS